MTTIIHGKASDNVTGTDLGAELYEEELAVYRWRLDSQRELISRTPLDSNAKEYEVGHIGAFLELWAYADFGSTQRPQTFFNDAWDDDGDGFIAPLVQVGVIPYRVGGVFTIMAFFGWVVDHAFQTNIDGPNEVYMKYQINGPLQLLWS